MMSGNAEPTTVRKGPCDGTVVMKPHPDKRDKRHGIGIKAPSELQTEHPQVVYCVYIWLPHRQYYEFVDMVPFKSTDHLRTAMQMMCKEEDSTIGPHDPRPTTMEQFTKKFVSNSRRP